MSIIVHDDRIVAVQVGFSTPAGAQVIPHYRRGHAAARALTRAAYSARICFSIRSMRELKRSALVARPPARLFALISDVERYPEFVPGCTFARIESRSAHEVIATLGVRRGALRAQFTTRNELEADRRVTMHLVRGPFRVLQGEWLLTPIADAGCQVDLRMRFAFSNPVAAIILEPLFAQTVGELVDAFVARARSTDS